MSQGRPLSIHRMFRPVILLIEGVTPADSVANACVFSRLIGAIHDRWQEFIFFGELFRHLSQYQTQVPAQVAAWSIEFRISLWELRLEG
jgi:hypothetical protein